MTDTTHKIPEIKALTGFRCVAALLVFLYHTKGSIPQPTLGTFPLILIQVGWCGVPFFFVLSGFLLTLIYFDSFGAGLTAQKLRGYAIKRFARVYPLYWFLLIIGTIFAAFRFPKVVTVGNLTSHFFMAHGFFKTFAATLIPAAWSLSIEESYYLILPVICVLSFGSLRRAPNRKIGIAVVSLSLLGLVAIAALLGQAASALVPKETEVGFFYNWINYTIFGQLLTFSLGMMSAVIVLKTDLGFHLSRPRIGNAFLTGGLALYLVGALVFRSRISWMEGWTGQVIFGTSAALLILSLYGRSIGSKILSTRIFVYGGKISYAFYLIHTMFMSSLFRAGVGTAIQFVMDTLLSILLYESIERPLQYWIRKRYTPQVNVNYAIQATK